MIVPIRSLVVACLLFAVSGALSPSSAVAQPRLPSPAEATFLDASSPAGDRTLAASPLGLRVGGALAATRPRRDAWLAADPIPASLQSASTGMAGWKRGLLWGGLVGSGLGIITYVLVDAAPCDSCSGTGADSSADGAFLEFAIGFGVGGAVLGALMGAL